MSTDNVEKSTNNSTNSHLLNFVEFSAVAQIADVRLLHTAFSLKIEALDGNEHSGLPVRLIPEIEWDQDSGIATFKLKFDIQVGEEESPLYTQQAIYLVNFRLPNNAQAEEEAIEQFAKGTVLFAVYPYLRELTQSSTTRAGIPPLTLGLFRPFPFRTYEATKSDIPRSK